MTYLVESFTDHPSVAIVVLNWNGCADTLECLRSLHSVAYSNFEVIVVDNGSNDGSVPAFKENFPNLTVVETGKNLGYAGGNNVGIEEALRHGADFVFLLNNDAVVDAQILNSFLGAADEFPEAGAFSGKIYYYSDPQRIWWAGSHWGEREGDFVSNRADEIDDGAIDDDVTESDYACGCAMFIRSELITRAGALDPLFF